MVEHNYGGCQSFEGFVLKLIVDDINVYNMLRDTERYGCTLNRQEPRLIIIFMKCHNGWIVWGNKDYTGSGTTGGGGIV